MHTGTVEINENNHCIMNTVSKEIVLSFSIFHVMKVHEKCPKTLDYVSAVKCG